jgi:hypothetical protein
LIFWKWELKGEARRFRVLLSNLFGYTQPFQITLASSLQGEGGEWI